MSSEVEESTIQEIEPSDSREEEADEGVSSELASQDRKTKAKEDEARERERERERERRRRESREKKKKKKRVVEIEEFDEEDAAESIFEVTEEEHAGMVIAILKPVTCTLILVVWTVTIINFEFVGNYLGFNFAFDELYDMVTTPPPPPAPANASYVPGDGSSGDGGGDGTTAGIIVGTGVAGLFSVGMMMLVSIVVAVVFVVVVLLVTFGFVLLFKYRFMKLIFGWLGFSCMVLFMLLGSSVVYMYIRAYNVPVDFFTFFYFMWNFSAVGCCVIFYAGPKSWNQAYMIFISSFIAVVFTRLPEWSTWTILGAIATYDLFAVLCPSGPLKMLVELAQERNEPIPALLYNASVFIMMAEPHGGGAGGGDDDDDRALMDAQEVELSPEELEREDLLDPDAEEKPARGIRLGLGDFVFYSVLVGRAAMYDWITMFTCFIGILTGLFWTLLLLAKLQKALPALPISIALGIAFYFLTMLFVVPLVNDLGGKGIVL